MAATDEDPSFVLTQNDLEFILRQIQISEAHAADQTNPSNYTLYCPDQPRVAQNCVNHVKRPAGVRTVDGSYNNLIDTHFGATDHPFPRLLEPEWRQAEPEVATLEFTPNTPEQTEICDPGLTCYEQTQGIVYDSHPREISNLIVDQTMNNPAVANQWEAGTGIQVPGTNRVNIPNTAPDEELSAPFNTFMGFFGQFFDHGLDLVGKAGNGSMVVPLKADDPLYCPTSGQRPNVNDPEELVDCNPDANYITLSRATRVANGTEHQNLTSPFIDQNQTYSSHPAHQVFLREYIEGPDGRPQATGRLIEGENGGMAKWRDVKAQATNILGLRLTDADLLDVPQVLVDPYGNFIPGVNGYPQFIVEGGGFVAGGAEGGTPVPDNVLGTGHAFLDDIAHGATPVVTEGGELLPRFDEDGSPLPDPDGELALSGYDNATLDEHYIAGDGRVNENIGLTAVHSVFHAEHNRMVGQIERLLAGAQGTEYLVAQDSEERGGLAEFAKAFRGETHSYKSDVDIDDLPGYVPNPNPDNVQPVAGTADDWSYQERLFQAAKFATEMQYQHLVFEEFARKVVPTIDAVVFNENSYDPKIDASITAEFAHVVYRFGHSMMTEEIGREPVQNTENNLIAPNGAGDVSLLDGFLAPDLFDMGGQLSPEEAAGSLINGMTSRVGSQIDEHVVDVLRNNLLGLPLDLPTFNLLRGRDVGVPPLQEARRSFFAATKEPSLAPYANWDDFGRNIKNGNNFGRAGERASLVNFVAAYGTHETILDADTIEEKRNAAALLVNGAPLGEEFVVRLAGSDRFETAMSIAERHFQAPVPVAYISRGNNFPDALAGGPLAAETGGPILLAAPNDTGEIPLATRIALSNLQPERIVILGGTSVVGPRAFASYNEIAPTSRIAGVNRFETAAKISQQLEPGRRVFIANGMNFPDALAGAAVAADQSAAMLLVQPNSIPAVTRTALAALDPTEIVVLGGTGAVSAQVAAQLRTYTDGQVVRLGGANRYETALQIVNHFFPNGSDTLYLATGANFPDALTATPAAGINGAPLLLVPPTGLTPALRQKIAALSPGRIFILGGKGVVSLAVEEALQAFAPAPLSAPEDRLDFMFSTGTWANTETGLDTVDFWMGGLAERLDPFGGMLGSTFNFVFETQLEKLQFGDRFYYLFRNQGEQLFAALEGNTFSDLIQRNTDASHLPADIFALQDPVIDIAEQAALPVGQREPGLSLVNGQWRWQGDEHIAMHGTPANDNLRGDEGDDAIWGYDGNDRIEGGSGNDALVGGKGDDIITDSFGDDNLKGKQGNDAMHTGPGVDLAIGGSGDDFIMNGGGDATSIFAGLGDDIVLGTSGRTTVFGGEHDDWVEGSSHADLLQGDNADQAQNDTLGGNDVVAGRLGDDDIEGEGGDDILIGERFGTDRHLGNLGFDWLTYYGQTQGVESDWAFNRIYETQEQLRSRYDLLEALSGGAGNDVLRGPLVEPDDLTTVAEAPLNKATQATLDLVEGFEAMLKPVVNGVAIGDFTLPIMRDAPEIDADGVHKVMIGGPGADTIEGRGGNDYLDGDAMLRVRLRTGTPGNYTYYDSAAELQEAVFSGAINPGAIDIARDIVYDDSDAIDIAQYNDVFDAYTVSELGFAGSGYWRVEHTAVQEAEESDGVDVIRGFERLQFADGCANIVDGQLVSCAQTAFATMSPTEPIEGQPVTAMLWNDAARTVPFNEPGATNLRFTWWAGEGDTADTVGEWEVLALNQVSPTYTPTQEAVGQFLRVTVSYLAANGEFRTAERAVSTAQVQDVQFPGALTFTVAAPSVGDPIAAGIPTDPDGLFDEGALTYVWSSSGVDPAVATEADWVAYNPAQTGAIYAPTADDIGRWIRVTITYQDGSEAQQTVSANSTFAVVE
ncbi:cell wall-binding repeat-containing protein [Microbacterium gallinarum]|uniref:Cell wall-binding repeat-containing protein n=1 Tax=Microbacterium gallinarum TaxID=2762209 RepID=A0ABR8X598_9MICO|nr:cell wall-binding repeat-containing protein [Microbacterium gallinarum]MBD8024373.1 cell wall-binding repeat-containing protein [Microbacterium gallinarum]